MKITTARLKQIIKEEIDEVLGDMRTQVPVATSSSDALRSVGGGDDKSLRKAIADFIVKGGEEREKQLAHAIGSYQYSDPYLVNLARVLLGNALAKASREKRVQVAKSVEGGINEKLQLALDEAAKKKDDKEVDPYERPLEAPLAEKDDDWIQKAVNPDHEGYCTPMTKSTCTPKRKAIAKRFKKAAKKKEKKGGTGWQGKF